MSGAVRSSRARRRSAGTAGVAVRIRAARPGEAAAVARVMRAAARGQRGRYPGALLAIWGSLPALYHRWAMSAGHERYLVAVRGARLLGYAAWRGGEVTAVFVLPSAGGRGLGARLLARAEAGARAEGARRLTVVAARGAVPFYLANGWRAGRPVRSALPGGAALPAARMWKAGAAADPEWPGARDQVSPHAAGSRARPPTAGRPA